MSKKHHNYTDYSKPQQQAPVAEPVVEISVVEEPVVEEVSAAPSEPEPVYGVVSECAKLNIRKEPNKDAAIVTVLDIATEVLVDESKSTEDFYKIVTGAGVEGYCMKKFIVLD